jgi:hypothetical protein
MSGSKPMKEVTMKKTRLISVIASLCLLAFAFQGTASGYSHGHSNSGDGGGDCSWFDGL